MPEMETVIKTENLKKYYGKVKAVDGINISVGKGEIYGFLGLNGAGKTTTIRMLLALVSPTEGRCTLKGIKVSAGNHALWNSIGYLVEIPYAYPELTVRENLEITRRLRLMDDKNATDRIMEKLNILKYHDRKVKNLSLGNNQRLGLAKAMIHNPEILILDEPANGLDPAGIVEVRELLQDLAFNLGVTIIISSHILGEISKFATRIGIIHEGKMVQESETDEMVGYLRKRLLIKVKDINGAYAILDQNGYKTKMVQNETLEVSGENSLTNPEKVNELLVNSSFPPSMVKIEEEDLESYFLRIIGKEGGDL